MRPAERRGRAGGATKVEAFRGDVGCVPHLLGEHQAGTCEAFERAHYLGRGQSHGEEVAGTLAGEHRPRAATAAAIPRRAVVLLAVKVARVAAPAGPGGQADFQ